MDYGSRFGSAVVLGQQQIKQNRKKSMERQKMNVFVTSEAGKGASG